MLLVLSPVHACVPAADALLLMLVATADFMMFYTGSETPPVVMSGYMDALARTQRRACAQYQYSSASSVQHQQQHRAEVGPLTGRDREKSNHKHIYVFVVCGRAAYRAWRARRTACALYIY